MVRHMHLLPCAALLALSSGALAFQSPTPPAGLEPFVLTWPTGVPTTGVTTTVVGDFTGDSTPDAWMITQTDLALFVNPSYMDASFPLELAATSIARIPKTSPQGKDVLACADANGLTLVQYDSGTVMFLLSTPNFPAWVNARSMTCYDLNQDGYSDLLAVNAAGNKLMRLMGDAQGGLTAVADINAPTGTYQALAMQWDPLLAPQIAALSTHWMTVVKQDGNRTLLESTDSTTGRLARIADQVSTGDAPDAVAWLRDAGSGSSQELWILDMDASQLPLLLQDPELPVVPRAGALFSGDVDNDGFEDLGFLNEDNHEVHVMRSSRSSASPNVERFTTTSTVETTVIAQWTYSPAPLPTPVIADLNNDRKGDLFVPFTPLAYLLAILRDPPVSPPPPEGYHYIDAEHECFERSDFYTDAWIDCQAYQPPPGAGGRLMFTLKDPWGYVSGDSIELVMYEQIGDALVVEPVARAHHMYELTTSMYRYTVGSDTFFRLPVNIPNSLASFEDKFYLIVRLVRANDTPETEFLAGFSSDPFVGPNHTGSIDYLVGLPGAWAASIPWSLANSDGECTEPIKYETGGMVPLLHMPRFESNLPPVPGAPTDPPAVIQPPGN